MRFYRKIIIGYVMVLGIVFVSYGCMKNQNNNKNKEYDRAKEVVIPLIFIVDPATNQRNNEELVQSFNKEFAGKYRVEVEWMVDTAAEYRARIKRLNVTDELPAIVTDIRFLPSFYQLLIKDKRLADLSSYIEEDEEWLKAIEPKVLNASIEEDGSIYLSTLGTSYFSNAGIFWNKELFAKAGIYSFPKTWEEFWQSCEKLSANGIVPLSLHTEGTAWAPMLFSTAALGDTKEGLAFMKTRLPENYENESGREMVNVLKQLFQYTTKDAINRDFDVAYEHFFNGETAMLPNGFWMLEQIDEEWKDKIGFAPFPENVLVASPEMSGWAVTNAYSKEVQAGAVQFLKYRTIKGYQQKQEFLQANKEQLSNAAKEYLRAIQADPIIVPNYQIQWNSILQDEVFKDKIPELASGKMNEKEFISYMNESVRQFISEQ